jgi:hypothetical protein
MEFDLRVVSIFSCSPVFCPKLGLYLIPLQKGNECGKVIYMGDVQGSEKVNDTCMKTCIWERWTEVSLQLKGDR